MIYDHGMDIATGTADPLAVLSGKTPKCPDCGHGSVGHISKVENWARRSLRLKHAQPVCSELVECVDGFSDLETCGCADAYHS